jgi:hypothetical protein
LVRAQIIAKRTLTAAESRLMSNDGPSPLARLAGPAAIVAGALLTTNVPRLGAIAGVISYGAGLPPFGIPLGLAVGAVGVWCLAHPERRSTETTDRLGVVRIEPQP